jgi:hypothetical protein
MQKFFNNFEKQLFSKLTNKIQQNEIEVNRFYNIVFPCQFFGCVWSKPGLACFNTAIETLDALVVDGKCS